MDFTELIEQGWITSRKHPEKDWFLLKYSRKAQYEHHWTEEIRAARSLVINSDGFVVSPCLPKFFNDFEGAEELKSVGFQTYEKLDGSMIYLFLDEDGKIVVRSSSMWTSDVALNAKAYAESINLDAYMEPNITYMCEWIHPLNRLVVNYGDKISLTLLCAIEHDASGLSPSGSYQFAPEEIEWPFDHVSKQVQLSVDEASVLKGKIPQGEEGYILWDRITNLRTKLKSAEYLELHRVRHNMNPRAVLEIIKAQDEDRVLKMKETLTQLDEQSERIFLDVYEGMNKEINDYLDAVTQEYEGIKHIFGDREFAEEVMKRDRSLRGGLFALRNKKPLDKLMYDQVDLRHWNEYVQEQGRM